MGDREESALKDIAIVMKQLDRTEEAMEAVKSFRGLRSRQAQESLDNSLYQGDLGWAYMQKSNYMTAEVVYRKAQLIDPDTNKALNLGHCLVKQARYNEAYSVLQDVLQYRLPGSDDSKSRLDFKQSSNPILPNLDFEDDFVRALERVMNEWTPARSKRLPIFEEISQFGDQLAC